MKNVSRRKFMALAAATAAAGTAVPVSLAAQEDTRKASPATVQKVNAAAAPVLEPLDLAKHYNTNVTLECHDMDVTLNDTPIKVRAYNHSIPGPLIVVRAGDTLNVDLVNKLEPYDEKTKDWNGDMDVPHHFGHTNLHLHGLDIAPHIFYPLATENAAAPMIALPRGEDFHYPFVIPGNQSPGLNWYHPHSHGSTVVQAVSGMAGALIIQGAIDEVPDIKAAKDYLVAIQDIGVFPKKPGDTHYSYEPEQNAMWQTFGTKDANTNVTKYDPETKTAVPQPDLSCGFTTGDYALRYYLVNGHPVFMETHNAESPQNPTPTQLTAPVINAKPGEVIRVRVLNACSDLMIPLQVQGIDMHLLAMDGNNFNEPRVEKYNFNSRQVILGPANRAEFMLRCPEKTGTYPIVQLAQNQQFLSAVAKTLVNIVVAGAPVTMGIPARLPPVTRDPPITEKDIKRRRRFVFASTFPGVQNPYVGIDFHINNQLYEEYSCPTVVALDTCEEWTLEVPSSQHGGTEGHPFHIHVNDFEVVSVGGIRQQAGTIQDTLWIQQETASVIRMRFKEWTGKSVFHCHILPHEETGMMQNFLILRELPEDMVDPNNPVAHEHKG